MIQIQMKKDNQDNITHIQVAGHANYAPFGHDIVCASVSTLLQVVGFTLEDRQNVIASTDFQQSGFGTIDISNSNRESHLITSVFEKGAQLLAEQYPEHVSLEMS